MKGALVPQTSGFTISKLGWNTLTKMLTTCRPAGSAIEEQFIDHFLRPLGVQQDKHGNLWKMVGNSAVAWSSHTDTVHRAAGYQEIVMSADYALHLKKGSQSTCLGADDTVGVWLMTEMIKHQRPGLYLFHRGEEIGGKGSRWSAIHNKELVKDFKAMIALDRRGNDSVITRQWGGRCCSDDFGKSLATKLGLGYKLDTGGSFTDSAAYTDLIGECSNLSVGYMHQHSNSEFVDIMHLLRLREVLIKADFSDLQFKRKPGEKEVYTYSTWRRDADDGYGEGYPYGSTHWRGNSSTHNGKNSQTKFNDTSGVYHVREDVKQLVAVIKAYPYMMADILLEWGFDAGLFESLIEDKSRRITATKKDKKTDDNKKSV